MAPGKKFARDEDGGERPTKLRGRGRARRGRKKAMLMKPKHGGAPLGGAFFELVLPMMVQQCECEKEHEPQVLVHLGDGNVLDVHRVVGVGDRFVVLSVFEEGPGEDGFERTSDDLAVEAVPFDLVLRATVRRVRRKQARRLGFSVEPAPRISVPAVEDHAPGPPPT